MADDTRQPREDLSKKALTVHPENKPFTGIQWQDDKAQPYQPPANANMMPGGTEHTAGGKVPEATFSNALTTIKVDEFKEIHKRPCVRDAFMTGIGAGFSIGGIRAIWGATVWTACSWAVGSAIFSSAGMHTYCQYRRHLEREGMLRAVEILNKKEVEKRAREARREKAREERRKAKDQEQDAQFAALKEAPGAKLDGGGGRAWWKVW